MANSRGMLDKCQSRISLDGLPMLDLIHVTRTRCSRVQNVRNIWSLEREEAVYLKRVHFLPSKHHPQHGKIKITYCTYRRRRISVIRSCLKTAIGNGLQKMDLRWLGADIESGLAADRGSQVARISGDWELVTVDPHSLHHAPPPTMSHPHPRLSTLA
jgi:hypothetical protein